MINPQEKYIALLHSSSKTSYREGRTLIFRNYVSNGAASSFNATATVAEGYNVGYLGYGLKNSLESLPKDDDFFITAPDSWFCNFKNVEVLDSLRLPTNTLTPVVTNIHSNMSKAEYLQKVEKIKKYILAGDIYQANLTRKFCGEFAGVPDAFALYCGLSSISPAPYSAYLKFDDLHIISSSPELFLRVEEGGKVTTCPIKGSKPQGQGAELQLDEKERAENLMITDLMRSDLSRACVPGSVKVEKLFGVDEFTTISHMHSEISGQLAVGKTPADALRECFPPGSMTGAPKIRAIEICSELEHHQRGIYSGALGYFNKAGGNLPACEFSVVIRTLIIKGNRFEFQVGGGITHGSDAEKEWEETMIKAAPIARLLGIEKQVRGL